MVSATDSGGVGELIDRVGRVARGLQFVGGLSPAQWAALRYVGCANRYSRNPSSLAGFLGTTKGMISQTLIALEGKGYVRRLRGNSDRRAVRLDITPAGEAMLLDDPLYRIDAMVASALAPQAASALVDGLHRLLGELQLECGGSEFGMCETCCVFYEGAAADEPGRGAYLCGLTGEALDDVERGRICVNFQSHS